MPVERKLQIKIPAGVDSGSQLRITGEGEPGSGGGPPGDLYVVLRIQEHPFFRREGANLFCEVPVTMAEAALGAVVETPTPEGGKAKVTLPEGTQTGSTFRLRGHGVPHLGSKGRGDLHVTVRVVVPTKLTPEQRGLLEQLAQTLPPPEIKERDRTLFDRMKDMLG
jgi:molecular chaperone DnaJ